MGTAPKPNPQWKPIENAQETSYARKITPQNVHQEYPRPTMVREKWLNLNGVWEMTPQRHSKHPKPREESTDTIPDFSDLKITVPEEETFRQHEPINETNSDTENLANNLVPEIDASTPELRDLKPHSFEPLTTAAIAKPSSIHRGQSVRLSRNAMADAYPYRILVPFPLESSLSGIQYPFDSVSYRRHFTVPDEWLDTERILLHFGACDWETVVIVNDEVVGTHCGGYDSFSFDISETLKKDGKYEHGVANELIVSVYDPTQNGGPHGKQSTRPQGVQCSSVSGIWQTVWLEPVPKTFIKGYVATPNIDESNIAIQVDFQDTTNQTVVVAEVFRKQKSVAKVYGGPEGTLLLPIPEEELTLWTPESPFLYTLKIELQTNGRTVDSVEGYFGMRKIDLAKDSQGVVRIRLNNMFRFQMGVLDPGLWPDGLYTAPSDEAMRREIRTIKELGFTMIRKHEKVEPERWYHWCDRLGVLVWQDMPSAANVREADQKQFEAELLRMIESRRNHPSVVVWILFHEGKGQHNTEHYANLLYRLDPSRLVDAASGWRDANVGQLVDLHRFPGPSAPKPEPYRASVLGEFGGIACVIPEHQWSKKAWGYQIASDPDDFLRRYRRSMNALEQLATNRTLCAAVYHQLTDVESQCNGLITYDRKVIKIPLETIRALNLKTLDAKL